MADQMRSFKDEFDNWRGNDIRANDILIIGLTLKVKAVFNPTPAVIDEIDEDVDD